VKGNTENGSRKASKINQVPISMPCEAGPEAPSWTACGARRGASWPEALAAFCKPKDHTLGTHRRAGGEEPRTPVNI